MFSLVLSTYKGESAEHLQESLCSISNQELTPDEVIIVGDGPLPNDQLLVINDFVKLSSFRVFFHYLPFNVGRGQARNYGIENTSFDWVALMDSDDICAPTRFSRQIDYLDKNPDVQVVATLSAEFEDTLSSNSKFLLKSCPENHDQIVSALRFSNCIANPTLLFHKSCWIKAGGFPHFKDINEDYLFYFRLIASKARLACVQEPLLFVRISQTQRERRRGLKLFMSDVKFRTTAYSENHVSFFWFILPLFFIFLRRSLPPGIDKIAQTAWRFISSIIHR